MARFIMVERKYVKVVLGVMLAVMVMYTAAGARQKTTSASQNGAVPEVQMVNVVLDPASITRDMTYGDVTLKGMKVIPAKTFDVTVTLENTTSQKITDVPLELAISLVGDETQKVIKSGSLQAIEPGAVARVTFHGVKAFGDALGKDAIAGQHHLVLRVNANPQGGVKQATAANYRFLVDSSVKKT
ncbi:MAG: hypothetical protein LBT22_08115 [Peptococcaceae bacterium]|jgi:hypothetical protein|nr:hypothetical protein [Peptococcaceae bacterium]